MGKHEQQQVESSKNAMRRSKRQRLATLAAVHGLTERPGNVKISNKKDAQDVEVAPTLQEMNCGVINSPHKYVFKVPVPPVIPHNSTPYPNVTPANSSNPHNSTFHPNVPPTNASNSQNTASPMNASNPQNTATPTNTSNPQNTASPANLLIQRDSSFEEAVQKDARKKRGKTIMKSLSLTPTEKAEVEFNEFGQPIGLNSKYLSSYLGTLAREMVPITISDWRKIDKSFKDDLWICIQTRFKLDALYKSLLIKMLGLRWKEAKSRLVSAIRNASTSPDAASRLAMLKPDNIKSAQEWNDFIKQKLSEEFELKSKKFKAIRAKNTIPHTMSRKGYARLAEDMKKESDCPSKISRDDLWCKGHTKKNGEPPNSIVAECITKIKEHNNTQSSQGTVQLSEDGVAKLFGSEHNGRVRGLGFGVTPSQLGVHMSHSKKVCALENQFNALHATVQELTDLFMASMAGKRNVAEDPVTPLANTSQSQRGSNNFINGGNMHTQDLPKKCKLLNWQNNVVAEGTIASTNPNALVHHIPLGVDVWKVWVDVALKPQALLWRENSEMSTIEQAVGTTVAWHKNFISFD